MSIATLILGESGSGKTASLRNMNPAHTLLIQAVGKPLPFGAKGWTRFNPATNKSGNVFVSDASHDITAAMHRTSRPIIVIDDFQYVLANEYMRRSDERGFEKFSDIGRHAWDILTAAGELAENKRVYILGHSQTDDFGRVRAKTIGKLLDEKIVVEGMFSIVLRTVVRDGDYFFTTVNSGSDTVKAPMGMFEDELIHNDLAAVDEVITNYYGITQPAAKAA
jgi:hypothetical protein